ncbi:histone-lysine N-methyltransferase SETMAR [Plakobranchus ocellatus]|uniref:Histone-lysine N-methyltransferase SETMAR n=1 Tax=Plakobranchus ocellatus TaxID=259542 RepID=A0AAV4CFU0_9GAST|nr:histone-lysine N-methyltransferase SETMAR [Plakobranchus ocellatus]
MFPSHGVANLALQWLQRYGWEILPHPAHSPDLAPSDFHLGGMAFETEDDLINWIKACAAMSILGMLSGLASLVPAIIALVMAAMKKVSLPILGKISIATAIASFCMILICVIIFAAERKEELHNVCDYGYSFGLSITGALLILPGGILPFFTTRNAY